MGCAARQMRFGCHTSQFSLMRFSRICLLVAAYKMLVHLKPELFRGGRLTPRIVKFAGVLGRCESPCRWRLMQSKHGVTSRTSPNVNVCPAAKGESLRFFS